MSTADFTSLGELAAEAEARGVRIAALAMEHQIRLTRENEADIRQRMSSRLAVMRASVEEGLAYSEPSASGLSGGDAARLVQAAFDRRLLGGTLLTTMSAYALAVNERNAQMGRIVAAPTAGSAGTLPAALLAVGQERGWTDDQLVDGLLTAAGIGLVIAARASLAGAEAGCQAECGSASAMAAAALVEVAGGTPSMVIHAAALALKSTLGLVCDPVAGLVEVPCVKRNAFAAVHALVAADLALAGIRSRIPPDEVLDAMAAIGKSMPADLRETARGGLAATSAGLEAQRKMKSVSESVNDVAPDAKPRPDR